ncbi:hypothetical protein [Ancylobacter sp.]|uniref:hypothetical protein n=1 Tax=Ancylobacter sp. TaxID=1872567 RepID=UPI003D11C839
MINLIKINSRDNEIMDNSDKAINGDALEMIRCGRFGAISVGDTLENVKEFLNSIYELEKDYFSWGVYDDSIPDQCGFAVGGLRIHLQKDFDHIFRIIAIVVSSLKNDEDFLDIDKYIYFRCHGLNAGDKLSTIKKKLDNFGINIIRQITLTYSVELHTSPFGVLVFEYYPPEGIFEDNASFLQFELRKSL